MTQSQTLYQPAASRPGNNYRERAAAALTAIEDALTETEVQLVNLHDIVLRYVACNTLAEARALPATSRPMWPHAPARIAMESRNGGDNRYMYVYWHQASDGKFQGPANQRKTYIGIDPADQNLVRVMSANHDAFTAAERAYENARQGFQYRVGELERLARECQATAARAKEAAR